MANRVYLEGNITRDTTTVPTRGMPMAFVHIAADRRWDSDDGSSRSSTLFSSVVCFGPLAEYAARTGVKGRPVAVEGSLRTRERENPDGTKRTELEIVADTLNVLESRTPSAPERDAVAEPVARGERAM
jgi:single-strand DNA-binding protein